MTYRFICFQSKITLESLRHTHGSLTPTRHMIQNKLERDYNEHVTQQRRQQQLITNRETSQHPIHETSKYHKRTHSNGSGNHPNVSSSRNKQACGNAALSAAGPCQLASGSSVPTPISRPSPQGGRDRGSGGVRSTGRSRKDDNAKDSSGSSSSSSRRKDKEARRSASSSRCLNYSSDEHGQLLTYYRTSVHIQLRRDGLCGTVQYVLYEY